RFALLGFAEGGPYALACASVLGEMVSGTTLVAAPEFPSGSPPGGFASNVAASLTSLLARRAPALYFRRLLRGAAPADRAALATVAARQAVLRSVREAFRHGSRGVAEESLLIARPWGIDLSAIHSPVSHWQPADDRATSVAGPGTLAAAIPAGVLTITPAGGRYWLLNNAAQVLG
ncbi:MAG: hypothetical protein ABIP13_09970, partial [Tepidiformaceae bacterium]